MGALLRDEGFQTAFAVALALSAVLVFVVRSRWVLVWLAGFVAPVAAVVGLDTSDRRAMLSLVGVVLVALGALAAQRLPWSITAVAVAPGALVMALALDPPVPDWAAVVLVASVCLVSPFVIETGRGAPRLLPLLLAVTALGMYATTPDTEHTRVLAGALVGAVLLAVDRRLRASPAGLAATVALMTWAAVIDGYPRRGAVVGAIGCFGAAVLLSAVQRARSVNDRTAWVVVLGIQAGVVLVSARVAGLRTEPMPAFVIVLVARLVAGVAFSFVLRGSRRRA